MKSYLKFLSRNKLYTAIEAVGLAVSLAFAILIGTYVWQQYGIAYENPDYDRIYIVSDENMFGVGYLDKESIDASIPEVEVSARYGIEVNSTVTVNNETYTLDAAYLDKEFFDIFPYYNIIDGVKTDLDDPSNVFISRRFANTLPISEEDIIGLKIHNNAKQKVYTVAGILEDFDKTLFTYSDVFYNVEETGLEQYGFDTIGSVATFIKVAEGTDRNDLFEKIKPVFLRNYQDWVKPVMRSLDEVYFCPTAYLVNHTSASMLSLLLVVVLALLASAVFNYINLSFALIGKRSKEMATRRLIGANKSDIFIKSILESVAFTLVCLVFAIALAKAFEPVLNNLIASPEDGSYRVGVSFDLSFGYLCIYFISAVALGIIVGLVPAVNISRFKPIDIIKGSFRRQDKMLFSKIFIVVQNILSVFLIAIALLMEVQLSHMVNRPMNATMDNLYYIISNGMDAKNGRVLIDRMKKLPEVNTVGIGVGYPGNIAMGFGVRLEDASTVVMVQTVLCDNTFFNLLKPEIVADYNYPLTESLWIGEQTAANLYASDSTAMRIAGKFNGLNGANVRHLGGIIKDIPTASASILDRNSNCAFVVQDSDFDFYPFGILINTYSESDEIREKIEAEYEAFAKEYGISPTRNISTFLSDSIREALAPAIRTIRLVELFMVLAVLLSLLGLVAMSTYFSEQKSKEIAVRKVFGGTIQTETLANVRSYMLLVLVACIIGVPVAVFAAGKYLEQFAYRITGYWWVFVVAVALSFLISLASVLWQTLRAARTNPATELKKE